MPREPIDTTMREINRRVELRMQERRLEELTVAAIDAGSIERANDLYEARLANIRAQVTGRGIEEALDLGTRVLVEEATDA